MYIFAAVNVLSISIGTSLVLQTLFRQFINSLAVWALYPESNQRTLEEMDLLFAAPTPWSWDAEKTFAALKEEREQAGAVFKKADQDAEAKVDSSSSQHNEFHN